MVDAVERINDVPEKVFTVISLPNVLWARISEESLTIRVQHVIDPIIIHNDDGLYLHYKGLFEEQRRAMVEPPTKPELVPDEKTD